MPQHVVIDELHLTVHVPSNLPEADAASVHRTLTSVAFMNRLRRAVRAVTGEFPDLARVRVTLSR